MATKQSRSTRAAHPATHPVTAHPVTAHPTTHPTTAYPRKQARKSRATVNNLVSASPAPRVGRPAPKPVDTRLPLFWVDVLVFYSMRAIAAYEQGDILCFPDTMRYRVEVRSPTAEAASDAGLTGVRERYKLDAMSARVHDVQRAPAVVALSTHATHA